MNKMNMMTTKSNAPRFVKPPPSESTLQAIRDVLREHRDLQLDVVNLEEQLKLKSDALTGIERVTLPELFHNAGIDQLGLPAEGNLPAYDASLEPFYRANIAVSWDEDRRAAAFDYLDANGADDLIKDTITIRFQRNSSAMRKKVIAALRKLKVEYSQNLTVSHSTLSAWLKHSVTKRHVVPQLDVIGGEVGDVVKLKPRR